MPSRRLSRGFRVPRSRKVVATTATAPARTKSPVVTEIDNGVPCRVEGEMSLKHAMDLTNSSPDNSVLLLYPSPTREEIRELENEWDLHPLLTDDLLNAHQRPKVERFGDVMFLVARAASYIDEQEEVRFSEFHVLMKDGVVAVLCQDGRWIDGEDGLQMDVYNALVARKHGKTALANQGMLSYGPEAIIYRLLAAIVVGYAPVLRGIAIDREQIERQVFSGDAAVAERIYRLSQEVIDMQHTIASLNEVIDSLRDGFDKYEIPEDLRTYLDDVEDDLLHALRQTADLRDALAQILSVNATLVSQRQNEDMKKISGWAAILFAPTLIGAIYGMNFDHMPELHWALGYPMAIGMMVGVGVLLYYFFRKSDWM